MRMTVEGLVTTFFVKYVQLRQLVTKAYKDSDATELNIYIDMASIVKPLFANSGSCAYEIEDPVELTASIVNMCGHYRQFFNGINVSTRFHIIFSWNTPDHNNKFVRGYNYAYHKAVQANVEMKDRVEFNCGLLKTLCAYLPEIYFYETAFDSGVLVHHLIGLSNQGSANMIISKDPYMLQCVAIDGCTMLRPTKYIGNDNSYIITPETLWEDFHVRIRSVQPPKMLISPKLISAMFVFSRFAERGYPSILSVPETYKFLYNSIEMGLIKNDYNSFQAYTFQAYDTIPINAKLPLSEIELRFKALDILYQYSIFETVPESKVIRQDDFYDLNGVHEINAKYFKDHPLDLDRL